MKRFLLFWWWSASTTVVLLGQIQRPIVKENLPEGVLMSKLCEATDPATITSLGEKVMQEFPNNLSRIWVLDQLRANYLLLHQEDKAVAMAQTILKAAPEEALSALTILKAAENRKQPGSVVEWASQTALVARKVLARTDPVVDVESAADLEDRKEQSRQALAYADYALYRLASQATKPTDRHDLVTQYRKVFPDGKYISQASALEHRGEAGGDLVRTAELAEQAVLQGDAGLSNLLFLTTYYFHRQPNKVVRYGPRLLEFATGPKPTGIPAETWNTQRAQALDAGYYIVGVTFNEEGDFERADKYLRRALERTREDVPKLASTLFQLGYANYRLAQATASTAHVNDAIRFSERCVGLQSPFQEAAAKNLAAVKAQFRID